MDLEQNIHTPPLLAPEPEKKKIGKVFKKKLFIFIGLMILLAAGSSAAWYLLRAGTTRTFDDGSLTATYRVWSISKNESSIRSVNDSIMAQQEIAYQPSLNLPADIWSEEISSAIEKNTGFKKEGMDNKDGVITLRYRGSRAGQEVEAESRVLLAGSNVYVLTFMTSIVNKEANARYKDEFVNSIKVLTQPPVATFELLGRIVTKLSDTKFLAESRDGEILTLVIPDDAKIFRRDKQVVRKDITSESSFGADGTLEGTTLTVKTIVFIDEEEDR